jgi:hypothetical protein
MLSVVMSMDSIKESVRLLSLSRISLDTFALPLRDLCPAPQLETERVSPPVR